MNNKAIAAKSADASGKDVQIVPRYRSYSSASIIWLAVKNKVHFPSASPEYRQARNFRALEYTGVPSLMLPVYWQRLFRS